MARKDSLDARSCKTFKAVTVTAVNIHTFAAAAM